ncbi:hypothetical protein MAPG_01382 [Magnaporthiopsis poae ATCC 64411]|uniref:Phosphoglycerate mutase n=1 Tax=Magnaporthiopsis poae (strain ATCC 64411 / 73-15) TaxID=644358 RepID=A0A0C4DNJ4_MAGP6|nr:hypothetical protein MAPG_01382 [Magnaporthiopsis poae ATCC 64411]
MAEQNAAACPPFRGHLKFSADPTFFVDYSALAAVSPDGRVGTQPRFGLAEGQTWPSATSTATNGGYKVIFYSRHGVGHHNVKEAEVGTAAWDAHWSLLDGDGDGRVWADAELTEEGVQQAAERSPAAEREARLDAMLAALPPDQGVPFPGAIYSSPLRRCLATTALIYGDVAASTGPVVPPVVKESLRERVTDHTCDRRSSRTWIAEHYPRFRASPEDLAEEDPLWRAGQTETPEVHVKRWQAVLQDIWLSDPSPFIAIVSHSMALAALLELLGLETFHVRPGTTFALLVKAEA